MTSPAAVGTDVLRAASLGAAALACLAPMGPAEARQPEGALPCNELCRAWLSWTPDRGAAQGPRPKPDGPGAEERLRPFRAAIAPPRRPRTSTRDRRAVEPTKPERSGSDPTEGGRDDGVARLRRPVPPRRPPALSTGPVDAAPAADGVPSPAGDEIATPVPPSSDEAADAAVLARPFYQPPAADAPVERDERPPVLPADPPAMGRDEPVPVARPPEPAAREAEPPAAPAPAEAPPPDPRPSEVRAAQPEPARVAPRPALPASDLEGLDEAEAPAPPAAAAAAVPSSHRPLSGALLLGALALLSLVGPRRRRPAPVTR